MDICESFKKAYNDPNILKKHSKYWLATIRSYVAIHSIYYASTSNLEYDIEKNSDMDPGLVSSNGVLIYIF